MDFSKMGDMLSQATALRAEMDDRLASTIVEAESGGGAVHVRMNGQKQLLKVTLAPSVAAAAADDLTLLEDLIVVAVNEAARKADAASESAAAGMFGGFNLPGL